jgi:DNA-binding transcriptional LysR family regulator
MEIRHLRYFIAVAEFSRHHPGIELHVVNQTTAEMVEGVRGARVRRPAHPSSEQ